MTKATKTITATSTKAAALAWYATTLKAWPTAAVAGAKPSADNFMTAHQLGAKPGSKTAVAIAMYLRPGGATQGQVFNVNGGPYLNKMRALIETGAAVRVPASNDSRGHTVYQLALPTKGKAAAKGKGKAAKAAAKPASARKGKGKPATPAAPAAPASEAANA